MLTVLWDSHGPILEHYQERGTTLTSVRYCDMLKASDLEKIERKIVAGCSFVAQQRLPSFCCMYQGNPSGTEI
jgi:hypothetical protein